jgi:hypothetical protein
LYIYKFNELNSRINTTQGKLDIDQIKLHIFNNLSKFYQHFRIFYYLINQNIAVVNIVNLVIEEEQFRKLQELDKKEKKINIILIYQTNRNRNNNQNINQNTNQSTNRRDKCDTYRYRHGREYMIKKNMISKN